MVFVISDPEPIQNMDFYESRWHMWSPVWGSILEKKNTFTNPGLIKFTNYTNNSHTKERYLKKILKVKA